MADVVNFYRRHLYRKS